MTLIIFSVLYLLVVGIIAIVGWCKIWDVHQHETNIRVDELPQLPITLDFDNYVNEYCARCNFFDGHDMCMHPNRFGTMTQNTIEHCNINHGE